MLFKVVLLFKYFWGWTVLDMNVGNEILLLFVVEIKPIPVFVFSRDIVTLNSKLSLSEEDDDDDNEGELHLEFDDIDCDDISLSSEDLEIEQNFVCLNEDRFSALELDRWVGLSRRIKEGLFIFTFSTVSPFNDCNPITWYKSFLKTIETPSESAAADVSLKCILCFSANILPSSWVTLRRWSKSCLLASSNIAEEWSLLAMFKRSSMKLANSKLRRSVIE